MKFSISRLDSIQRVQIGLKIENDQAQKKNKYNRFITRLFLVQKSVVSRVLV